MTDGLATSATFSRPGALAIAKDGTIYVADGPGGIRAIADGKVTRLPISAGHSRDVASIALYQSPVSSAKLFYTTANGIGRFDLVARKNDAFDTELMGGDGIVALSGSQVAVSLPRRSAIYFNNFEAATRRVIVGDDSLEENGRGTFADGPPDRARFSEPRGLALDTLGRLLVADRGNHRVRRVSAIDTRSFYMDGRDLPTDQPSDVYRVAYMSNSFTFYDVMWDDSIEGRIETYLNAHRVELEIPKPVRLYAVRYGSASLKAQSDFLREFIAPHGFDLVIWSINSPALKDDFTDYLFTLPTLDRAHEALWKSQIDSAAHELADSKTKLILTSVPLGLEVGPSENYLLKDETSLARPPYEQTLRTPDFAFSFSTELERFLATTSATYVPTYDRFVRYERGPHVPLFEGDDFHPAPNGSQFIAALLDDALARLRPWAP